MKHIVKGFIFTMLLISGSMLFQSCEDPQAPQQAITIDEADQLEEEFKRTRARILNDALGFEDTRDFWFSLDTLKKYIEYVEYEGTKMGKDNLGIRIYFAAYPDNSGYPDPGYSTVFLVPTAAENPNNAVQGFMPIIMENQTIDDLKALNYSMGGRPPNDL